MIIGIDASRANHEQKTGVEWYAYHLIEELKHIIPDTHRVVLYSDVPLTGPLSLLPSHWESRVLRWSPKRLWTQVRLSYEMLVRPPDLLWIPAHVFPLIHPRQTIMTVHDVAAVRFPKSYSWFERWYSVWSARFAARHLSRIITPTEFVKQELLDLAHHTPSAQIVPVHHGFDNAYGISTEHDTEAILSRYGITRPFLISLGRLEEKKNTVRIIETFNECLRRHNNLFSQLVLIGKPGYGYDAVERAIHMSPYRDRIITPGWVAQEDMPALLSAASVCLFPSLYEGFGIPLLEGMAAGVPVVTSTGSSLEEVGGSAAVYVDPHSVPALADAVETFMSNTAIRESFIRRGKERVAEFSWRICAEKTWQVLVETLQK